MRRRRSSKFSPKSCGQCRCARVAPVLKRIAAASLCLFVAAGCRAPDVRPDVANEHVRVIEVKPVFLGEGNATLSITVDMLPLNEDGAAEAIDWELWLNTRHFASGVQVVNHQLSSRQKTRLTVEAPLIYRGLPGATDRTLLTIAVRGGVRVKLQGTEARFPFESFSKQSLENVPVFEGAEEE